MSDPNVRQVGGDHYAKGGNIQHWDFVEVNGMGYLEGCATKYVTRWRHKNGVQDLDKSLHYIEKLRSLAKGREFKVLGLTFRVGGRRNRVRGITIPVQEFSMLNGLTEVEERVCMLLLTWSSDQELREAYVLVTRLIEAQRK